MGKVVEAKKKAFEMGRSEKLLGYLEVLARSGRTALRVPLTSEEVRIGRAFDNDVVIDDPYVCPHHIRLLPENDRLIAQDLGSKNGLLAGKGRRKEERLVLGSGEKFRIGRTTLRFRACGFRVEKTLVDRFTFSPLRFLWHPLSMIFVCLLSAAYLSLDAFMSTAQKFEAKDLVEVLMSYALILILWSACWSFTGRMTTHKWNFTAHCAIASVAVLFTGFIDAAISYTVFSFDVDSLAEILEITLYTLLAVAVLYAHLGLVSQVSSLKLGGVAAGIILLVTGSILLVSHLNESDFSDHPLYRTTLKPPPFKVAESISSRDFFKRIDRLRTEVDRKLVKKETGEGK